jgi:murein DD-endopeptidase MepM/ murein hydrolase activator NlpD
MIKTIKKLVQNKRYPGNSLSRVIRRFFEKVNAKKILGINLVAITFLTGVIIPSPTAFTQNSEAEITAISATATRLTTELSVRIPVEEMRVTQGYRAYHPAVDLGAPLGSPVYPIMDGKVEITAAQRFGYGNHIIIDHGSEIKSLYAHLSKILVKEGEEVDKGTVIGLIGSTGWSTGPHLHLEVYDNGQTFNPLTILK